MTSFLLGRLLFGVFFLIMLENFSSYSQEPRQVPCYRSIYLLFVLLICAYLN